VCGIPRQCLRRLLAHAIIFFDNASAAPAQHERYWASVTKRALVREPAVRRTTPSLTSRASAGRSRRRTDALRATAPPAA
jgi:hypothetical protein